MMSIEYPPQTVEDMHGAPGADVPEVPFTPEPDDNPADTISDEPEVTS